MTLKQVIDMVDAIKPNAFDEATKTIWVNEVEGFVQTEVFLLAVEDVIEYAWPTDQNTELLVEPPHSKLYWTYLSAMVDFANGEYSKYNNTMQVYNAFMSEYMRWFAAHYRPADGRCIEQGYYISAYGIAVKHGYTGSEEDWIASLKGERGYSTEIRYNSETNYLEWKYEDQTAWTNLMSLTELQTELEAATIDEVISAKLAAQSAATSAAASAGAAASRQAQHRPQQKQRQRKPQRSSARKCKAMLQTRRQRHRTQKQQKAQQARLQRLRSLQRRRRKLQSQGQNRRRLTQ